MINQKCMVFLESNTTGTGELLIHRALVKGLRPIFITDNPKKYSFLPLDKMELVTLDTSNKNILLDHLKKINNLVGIHSSSDSYVEITAWLAQELGLPGACYEAVKLCRDKYAFYQALTSLKMSVPYTRKIYSLEEAENWLSDFPVVVKPCYGTGSKGVKLCQTNDEILKHVSSLFDNNYTEVLIQEYVDAPEFSIEVCSLNGRHHVLGITKKHLSKPPCFIEVGHDFPAILPVKEEDEIKSVIVNLLTFLNFDFGFSHIEFKIKDEKIIIIEVNPRLAGGMIPQLIEKSTGFDVLSNLIDLFVGQDIELKLTHKNFSSIRHLIPSNLGKIIQLNFIDMISVDEVKIIKSKGETFVPQGDFRDRVAYCIVSDKDPLRCQEKADQAVQCFDLNII